MAKHKTLKFNILYGLSPCSPEINQRFESNNFHFGFFQIYTRRWYIIQFMFS